MFTKFKYFFIRNYYLLFQPKRVIQAYIRDDIFDPGEVIISSSKDRDMLYLGKGQYLLGQNFKIRDHSDLHKF